MLAFWVEVLSILLPDAVARDVLPFRLGHQPVWLTAFLPQPRYEIHCLGPGSSVAVYWDSAQLGGNFNAIKGNLLAAHSKSCHGHLVRRQAGKLCVRAMGSVAHQECPARNRNQRVADVRNQPLLPLYELCCRLGFPLFTLHPFIFRLRGSRGGLILRIESQRFLVG